MADAEAVINNLPEKDNLTYIGLAMNERGVDRALKTKIDEIGLVVVATDTFAKKNQNQTRDSSIKMASSMVKKIKSEGRKVNVTIAASFGCPFEGEVEIGTVVEMAQQIAFSNPDEISIADTIGVGDPWKVKELFSQLKSELPTMPLRAHFHNTRNTGLANVYTAIECGVNSIDVSIGGIGGCPARP
jgi:hydroxymethylglutaryl-CoA lyase